MERGVRGVLMHGIHALAHSICTRVFMCLCVCNKWMDMHVFVLDEWNERRMENGEKC